MGGELAQSTPPRARALRRGLFGLIGIAIIVVAVLVATQLGNLLPGGVAAATGSPRPASSLAPASTIPASAGIEPSAPPPTAPPPTPVPTPRLIPAPLTGLPVSEVAASRHAIAVMVDDHALARPQVGFNAASVVWHAPAEGGVPRYMLLFQDEIPNNVGPIRSARQYYIEWAAEWNAMYVHHGGSPQARATLRQRGNGTWVWNADGFRWEGQFFFRARDRFAPHNVVTDGAHLRQLAERLGAVDAPIDQAWTFAPDPSRERRPKGGAITVTYPYESITYRYHAATNTYRRFINGSTTAQVDAADGEVVAPKNVVILRMFFGLLTNDPSDQGRLEARTIGSGEAWVSSNGRTVKGEWRKASATAPTLLYDLDGEPLTLTAGQTFVQVLAMSYGFSIEDGRPPDWHSPGNET